ncbi:DUF4384 domain-containing protein, partial [Aquicoccus sp. SCR17]|nr:DUF4384 domain-containing protein [Carideicomes alvinocaridis]
APAPQAAPAAEAPTQTLANLAAESDPLAPSPAQPQRAEPATAPPLIAARAEPDPDRLPAATARPAILDAAKVPQPIPAALALPETAPLPQAQPAPDAAPEARPKTPRLPDTPAPTEQATSPAPDPQPVAPTEGPVTRGRATLAFEGMADLSDPVSVAAVQSFMAPGTLPEGEDVRDGMSALLSGVPCARLQARFRPETGALELIGHVPEEGAAASVLAALRDRMGADIPVTSNLRVLPRPQCQVLGAVEAVGLPQSTDQITNRLLVGEDTHAREFRYAEGDRLVLDLSAPDYDAYLYVDYFDASGQVIHLQPNETVPLDLVPAKSAQQVGARNEGEPGLSITIGPPYGQELAVAFAASEPLYDEPRPLVEPAGPYLDFLRERIAAAREADPEFRGEWVYFLVVTRPS